MPSGGARVVSGPPPDPNALSRNRPDDRGWTVLPAEGRKGDPPLWPLVDQTSREAQLWADMWTKPQAIMWERLDQSYEVAMLCRTLARAEQPKSPIELMRILRQYLDSLGLSVQGINRARWRIEATSAPATTAQPTARPRRSSARSRFKVVPHGEAGS